MIHTFHEYKSKTKNKRQLGESSLHVQTILNELSQPVTALQIELDIVTLTGETPSPETIKRLHQSISEVTALLRNYQQIY